MHANWPLFRSTLDQLIVTNPRIRDHADLEEHTIQDLLCSASSCIHSHSPTRPPCGAIYLLSTLVCSTLWNSRSYLYCSHEWHYLHPKTYPLRSSSGCRTFDYTIHPLSFWHAAPSAYPPGLRSRWHCPSVSVLAACYHLPQTVTTLLTYCTTWKLQLNTHETQTILFSKRHPPPTRSYSKPGHVCPPGLGSTLSRPCARFKTSLHPTPAHRHQ